MNINEVYLRIIETENDSDVVKPEGYKFESLGIVRDGSESTATKSAYKKGYHVTEACVLTGSNHPVSSLGVNIQTNKGKHSQNQENSSGVGNCH